jgi:hypothetical protein
MCRKCADELPKERIGWNQLCAKCWDIWYQKFLGIQLKEHDEGSQSNTSNDRPSDKNLGGQSRPKAGSVAR